MIEEVASGEFVFVAAHSGKCLDLAKSSDNSGGTVHRWSFHNKDNQRWEFEDRSGGAYRIRSVHSGKYVDVESVSTAPDAQIQQWGCGGGGHQAFRVIVTDGGASHPPGTHPDIVYVSPDASTNLSPGGVGWVDGFSHNGHMTIILGR